MSYEIIRGPFILMETVEMLYKYVNNISILNIASRLRLLRGGMDAEMQRRMERLQKLTQEVCGGLDPNDPVLRKYFERVATDCYLDDTCLALMLTCSFCTMKVQDLRGNIEEICQIWESLQKRGAWIRRCGISGLEFSSGCGSPGDVFDQVYALELPADFRLTLYKTLREFRSSMEELRTLIEPVAEKLQTALENEPWLMGGMEQYWDEVWKHQEPHDFLVRTADETAIVGAGEKTLVAYSLMSCDRLVFDMAGVSLICQEHNFLYIGSTLTKDSTARRLNVDIGGVGAIMKSIGDKKRLEILQRLSKKRSYCHELADQMGLDPGHMSRNLSVLHSYGFLRQERESLKNYYRTDPEAIRNFLKVVETTILG